MTSPDRAQRRLFAVCGDHKDVQLPRAQHDSAHRRDDGMLRYQKALFERRGYKVLTAASARQGLRIAAVYIGCCRGRRLPHAGVDLAIARLPANKMKAVILTTKTHVEFPRTTLSPKLRNAPTF